jgi:hypothetical protein
MPLSFIKFSDVIVFLLRKTEERQVLWKVVKGEITVCPRTLSKWTSFFEAFEG